MHGRVSIEAQTASNYAAISGQECFVPTASGDILPPAKWFMQIAHGLWPDKPGAWIRSLTGFPDRTCRSAAAGDTEVSAPMLYALFRGEQGGRVYDKLMEGCTQPWFIERQKHERMGRAADSAK